MDALRGPGSGERAAGRHAAPGSSIPGGPRERVGEAPALPQMLGTAGPESGTAGTFPEGRQPRARESDRPQDRSGSTISCPRGAGTGVPGSPINDGRPPVLLREGMVPPSARGVAPGQSSTRMPAARERELALNL